MTLHKHLHSPQIYILTSGNSLINRLNRFTNNWKGSTQGWEWVPSGIPEFIEKEIPGLKNFYLIGQWTIPGGGVSSALISGRDITRIICKKDKRNFRVR